MEEVWYISVSQVVIEIFLVLIFEYYFLPQYYVYLKLQLIFPCVKSAENCEKIRILYKIYINMRCIVLYDAYRDRAGN